MKNESSFKRLVARNSKEQTPLQNNLCFKKEWKKRFGETDSLEMGVDEDGYVLFGFSNLQTSEEHPLGRTKKKSTKRL